jgi:anti-sigma regulatory factor (Ser/Thr protein kinase)
MASSPVAPRSHFHKSVSSDLANLAEIRQWLGGIGNTAGLSEPRTFDLQVVTSEAVANAIEHAASAVEIEAWALPDRLIVEIS